jgi:hypothetical protein
MVIGTACARRGAFAPIATASRAKRFRSFSDNGGPSGPKARDDVASKARSPVQTRQTPKDTHGERRLHTPGSSPYFRKAPNMPAALMRLPQVREKLDVKSNATVHVWCKKHGVEVLTLNARARAVRVDEFERALEKATA